MNEKRPINLQLNTIKFPIPAIVSILHRLSGVGLFLFVPFLLWLLNNSLQSPLSFYLIKDYINSFFVKFLLWLVLTGLFYHIVAGVRHLLMDMGVSHSLQAARLTAKCVLVIGILGSISIGVWLW